MDLSPGPALAGSSAAFETSAQSRLLVLPGNRVIAWDEQGRIWVRHADGKVVQFQVAQIKVRSVTRADDDLLVVGIGADLKVLALRVNLRGAESDRWMLPEDAGYGVDVRSDPLRVRTRKSEYRLREKGGIEEQPVKDLGDSCSPAATSLSTLPKLLQPVDAGIVCHPADLAKATARRGHCWQVGEKGWQLYGQFREMPFICGSSLVTRDGADQASVVVYDVKSGKKQSARSFRTRTDTWPEIACIDGRTLLVGTRDLVTYALPSLRAGKKVQGEAKGGEPIVKLVVSDDLIAFRRRGSASVVVLDRAR